MWTVQLIAMDGSGAEVISVTVPIEEFDPRALLPAYSPTGELLGAGGGPPPTTSTSTRTCSPDPEHPLTVSTMSLGPTTRTVVGLGAVAEPA
ncbi:hypothetical protein [Amycolatopsis thermophila]|uniref:Uncharacterized protein n=1 Tax=Amycolatopsis thermophila TaxID=206084 RepID=A0ABU0ELW3_9PSEU|nr:hypothetical protein [Amycolatopsis thermophila]MDQ0376275.1 hypothetical protein [Amycolatopsis thermophila]